MVPEGADLSRSRMSRFGLRRTLRFFPRKRWKRDMNDGELPIKDAGRGDVEGVDVESEERHKV